MYQSIEKAKQPQRNFVSEAGFNVIGGNEAVAYILDLVICFSFAADFKGISRFYKKVSPVGKLDVYSGDRLASYYVRTQDEHRHFSVLPGLFPILKIKRCRTF